MTRPRMIRPSVACPQIASAWLGVALVLGAALGCATPGGFASFPETGFHLSRERGVGDPARRASTQLVLDGLEAEASGRGSLARELYQRALQVDPTNPWVYVALARTRLDAGEAASALAAVDQARALLDAEQRLDDSVRSVLDGLAGAALLASGRIEQGQPLLERARRAAPRIWEDGRLDPLELR